jgi:hypothetical protein
MIGCMPIIPSIPVATTGPGSSRQSYNKHAHWPPSEEECITTYNHITILMQLKSLAETIPHATFFFVQMGPLGSTFAWPYGAAGSV